MSKYSIGPVVAMELIVRAKKERMWVRTGKDWFTPELFMDLFKDNRPHEFEDLPIVYDPRAAVEEGKATIQAMQTR